MAPADSTALSESSNKSGLDVLRPFAILAGGTDSSLPGLVCLTDT